MRECPEEIMSFAKRNEHEGYKEGISQLKQIWFGTHQMILSQYERDSLYVFPLSDPNENKKIYIFCVSEIILKIIQATTKRINALPEELNSMNFKVIFEIFPRLYFYLFQEKKFESLKMNIKKEEISSNINDKTPTNIIIACICNFFSETCQEMIKKTIKIGEIENPDENEIKSTIDKLIEEINALTTIYLPMIIGDTDMPFTEFYQLMLDLYEQSKNLIEYSSPKWTDGASFPKIPQLSEIKKNEKISSYEIIDKGIEGAKDGATKGVILPMVVGAAGSIIGIILIFTPLTAVGASLLTMSATLAFGGPAAGSVIGAVAGAATNMIENGVTQQAVINEKSQKLQDELKEKIVKLNDNVNETVEQFIFYYPLIWDKKENVSWEEFNKSILKQKNQTFFLFVDDDDQCAQKTLHAFISIPPSHLNMMSKLKNIDLKKRFSKSGKKDIMRSNDDFIAIYCDLNSFFTIMTEARNLKIPDSKIIVVYTLKKNSAIKMPLNITYNIHVLYLYHSESCKPYTKEIINHLSNSLTQANRVKNATIIYHPIDSDNLDYSIEGPRCNTTIKEAFHSILFKP